MLKTIRTVAKQSKTADLLTTNAIATAKEAGEAQSRKTLSRLDGALDEQKRINNAFVKSLATTDTKVAELQDLSAHNKSAIEQLKLQSNQLQLRLDKPKTYLDGTTSPVQMKEIEIPWLLLVKDSDGKAICYHIERLGETIVVPLGNGETAIKSAEEKTTSQEREEDLAAWATEYIKNKGEQK
jgi:hypothetical protein